MEEPLRIGYSHIWIFNMEEYCRIWHCVWHSYIRSSLDYIGLLCASLYLYLKGLLRKYSAFQSICCFTEIYCIVAAVHIEETGEEECHTNMGRSLLTWHSVSPTLETALIGEPPSFFSSIPPPSFSLQLNFSHPLYGMYLSVLIFLF